MNSIKAVVNEPIEGNEEYHIMVSDGKRNCDSFQVAFVSDLLSFLYCFGFIVSYLQTDIYAVLTLWHLCFIAVNTMEFWHKKSLPMKLLIVIKPKASTSNNCQQGL